MSEESEVEARGVRVSNFLAKKDKASALAAALQNPPVNEKSEELKVNFTIDCEIFRVEILTIQLH